MLEWRTGEAFDYTAEPIVKFNNCELDSLTNRFSVHLQNNLGVNSDNVYYERIMENV